MNKNEKFVITINREIGSGGHTVGGKIATKLGVPYYDKAVIQGLMGKYNLSIEEIESLKGRKQDWWSEFKRVIGIGRDMSGSVINEPDLYSGNQPTLTPGCRGTNSLLRLPNQHSRRGKFPSSSRGQTWWRHPNE